jgi:hypothetical protein
VFPEVANNVNRQIRLRSPHDISQQGDICQIRLTESWGAAKVKTNRLGEMVRMWKESADSSFKRLDCGGPGGSHCQGQLSAKTEMEGGTWEVPAKRGLKGWRMEVAQAVQWLPSKCDVLSSNPNTTKKDF